MRRVFGGGSGPAPWQPPMYLQAPQQAQTPTSPQGSGSDAARPPTTVLGAVAPDNRRSASLLGA